MSLAEDFGQRLGCTSRKTEGITIARQVSFYSNRLADIACIGYFFQVQILLRIKSEGPIIFGRLQRTQTVFGFAQCIHKMQAAEALYVPIYPQMIIYHEFLLCHGIHFPLYTLV